MKNKTASILIRVFILILSCAAFYQAMACSGSAAPVAVIPDPYADDPITISAPNADGYVTVTGGEDSVGASSVVILEVSEATSSSISLLKLCDALVGEAYATTCSSDLPACPTLDSDNKCQVSSDSDGAFTTTVPASASDQITVYYLDPTDCSEVTVGTSLVTSNVMALSTEAVGVEAHPTLDYLYILGNDEDGVAEILKYDLDDGTYITYIIDLGDAAVKLHSFSDANNNFYLIVKTSEHMILVPVESAGEIDQDQFVTILGSDLMSIDALKFLHSTTKQYDATTDTCVSASLFDDLTNATFTRLIFGVEDSLFYVDFDDNWMDSHDFHSSDPSYYVLNKVEIITNDVLDITGTEAVNSQIALFKVLSTGSVDGVIALSDGDDNYYAVFNLAVYDFCAPAFSLGFDEDLMYVDLGTSANTPRFQFGLASNDTVVITALKRAEEQLYIVNPFVTDEGEMQCLTNGAIDLPTTTDSTTTDSSDCAGKFIGDAVVASNSYLDDADFADLEVTDISIVQSFLNSKDKMELFVVGANNSGYEFIVTSDTDSLLKNTDSQINVLTPTDMSQAGYYIYIVDQGNASDGTSNLIIYEMLESID